MSEYECPKCEYTSDTEMGVKVHYGQVHDGSISGVEYECDHCKVKYRDVVGKEDQDSTFCSVDCKGKWQQSNGNFVEDNPQYQGGPVEVECGNCGKVLQRKQYRIENTENHYCDIECRSEDSKSTIKSCEWCGDDTVVSPSKKKRDEHHFCSDGCYGKWRSENVTGKNHPRYNSVETVCSQCGSDIKVMKCRYDKSDHNFCNKECRSEWQTGENHPRWNGGKEEIECYYCGEVFEVYPNEVGRDNNEFCSRECVSMWQSESMGGPAHHWWTGGTSFYHSIRRNLPDGSWRRTSREYREGKSCENCGKNKPSLDRGLSVHHIIPVKSGGTGEEYNLMALCHSCHMKAEMYINEIVDHHLVHR